MDQQIITAIQSRHVVSLVFMGRLGVGPLFPIDLEPYIYGRLRSGDDFLFGWYRTGRFPNWRAIWLARAKNVQVTEQTFEAPRPGIDVAVVALGDVAAVYCQIEGVPAPPVAARTT